MSAKNRLTTIGFLVLLGLIITTLIISIVTLVKVSNQNEGEKGKDGSNNPTTPSPTTKSPSKPSNSIPEREQISESDPRYSTFNSLAKNLEESIDTRKNPCNNFYEYVCENVKEGPIYTVARKMRKKSLEIFDNIPDTPKYKKFKVFWDTCLATDQNTPKDPATTNGTSFINGLNKLQEDIGYKFPLMNKDNTYTKPDLKGFARILSVFTKDTFMNSLAAYYVDIWYDRSNKNDKAYTLHFVEPIVTNSPSLYHYDDRIEKVKNTFIQNNLKIAKFLGAKISKEEIAAEVDKVVDFQLKVLNLTAKAEQNPSKLTATYTAKRATDEIGLQDYSDYLKQSFSESPREIQNVVNDQNFEFVIHNDNILKEVVDYLKSDELEAKTLINLFFFNYIETRGETGLQDVELDDEEIMSLNTIKFGNDVASMYKRISKLERKEPKLPSPLPLPTEDEINTLVDDKKQGCLILTTMFLRTFNQYQDKLFVDNLYPNKDELKNLRKQVGDLANKLITGFQYQLSQLNWMSESTRKNAYNKVVNVVKNIAYNTKLDDEDYLDKFYADLNIKDGQNIGEMLLETIAYEGRKNLKLLLEKERVDRDDFLVTVSTVNAWYQPYRNSITIPVAFLQSPLFEADSPISWNYGGLGLVVGHEIVHGFDNQGINWDEAGYPIRWTDENTQNNFNKMAKCVIDQYGKFKIGNETVNGKFTQGENIADNGGIRAAYNAYKSHVGLTGDDPALPSEFGSTFTNDQLFFISFSRFFCRPPQGEINPSDPHSPNKFRTFGTLQNFPEFKTAFNCRKDDDYAKQQCTVWAPADL